MKLLLSSDAAPDAPLAQLTEACQRRTLAGLELTVGAGHKHGLDDALSAHREQPDVTCSAGDYGPIQWLKVTPAAPPARQFAWVSHAQRLDAGLLLSAPPANPLKNVRLAFIHGTTEEDAIDALHWARRYNGATCWELNPNKTDAQMLGAVLDLTRDHLTHVRYLGAGPEAERSQAADTNPLWALLARHGYQGTIALVPSAGGNLQNWHRWLFDSRGWGCNTAAEKADAKPQSTIHQQHRHHEPS